jgi:chromosome segregation ATPase
MNIELLLAVNGFLTVLLGVSIKALASVYSTKFKLLEMAKDDHEKRLQKQEDTTSIKLELLQVGVKETKDELHEISQKFDELSQKVTVMSANIHGQKNSENSLNATLTALLKHLQHYEKGND